MKNVAELLRLIHNLIRLGTIAEVDHDAALCRIKLGDNTSSWISWINTRAGTTRTWNPPTVGEQALMFSPGGDPASAIALVGLYQNLHPAPSNNANVFYEIFPDGAEIEYNHQSHELRANIPGKATVTATGGVTLNANTVINGNATINGTVSVSGNATLGGNVAMNGGTVTHGGVNIGSTHKHGGVVSGPSQTGLPS